MNTHTHTSGPFPLVMHKSDSDNVPHLIITNQGNHFASTYDPLAARLIAAAPELLAALKELLADKYLAAPINADRMAKTRAAIAKAERGVE